MTPPPDFTRLLEQLAPAERERVGAAFARVIELFERASERLTKAERYQWFARVSEAIERFADIVDDVRSGAEPEGRTGVVGAAPPAPRGELDGEQPSLAELEKLNTANVLAQWRQAIRESFSAGELVAKGVSRQQLEQWRKRRRLIGLAPPFERGFFYPVWEFDEQAQPHRLIPELVDAAEEARLDPLSLHRLMVSETVTPDGPLMLALRQGRREYVLGVVRAAAAQGG